MGRQEFIPLEPKIKFSGQKIIQYGQYHGIRKHDPRQQELAGFNKSEHVYSTFGVSSKRRLSQYVNTWMDTIFFARSLFNIKSIVPERRHTFVTLTIPSTQIHCDKIIKREILNKFIIELQREYGLTNYIWKSELQVNGNLHFHFLTSIYIDAIELRLIWLWCCNELGYVDSYYQSSKKFLPNATDVHALQKIKNVSTYVCKYMSKESTLRPICGHTWGRSDGIDKLQNYSLHESLELSEWYKMMVDSAPNKFYSAERFAVTSFFSKPNFRSMHDRSKELLKEITMQNLSVLNLAIK